MNAAHVPHGHPSSTPYRVVDGADAFLAFVEAAFGGRVLLRRHAEGRVAHAEVSIEGAVIEVGDARPEWPATRVGLHLFVADPDAVHARALAAGAALTYPLTDHPYGERSGGVRDRWGNDWFIAAVTDPVARAG